MLRVDWQFTSRLLGAVGFLMIYLASIWWWFFSRRRRRR